MFIAREKGDRCFFDSAGNERSGTRATETKSGKIPCFQPIERWATSAGIRQTPDMLRHPITELFESVIALPNFHLRIDRVR